MREWFDCNVKWEEVTESILFLINNIPLLMSKILLALPCKLNVPQTMLLLPVCKVPDNILSLLLIPSIKKPVSCHGPEPSKYTFPLSILPPVLMVFVPELALKWIDPLNCQLISGV